MKKSFFGRSGLLLTEIIFAVLSFSIVSAICLEVFVKAHNLSRDTKELDMAVRQSSSIAEILCQAKEPMETLQKMYPDSDIAADFASFYFDQDFLPCSAKNSSYHLDLSSTLDVEQTTNYYIAVYENDDIAEIYHLEVTAYKQYTL